MGTFGTISTNMSDLTSRPRTGFTETMGYSLPELRINKSGCYVDYYARHPLTGRPKFKRVKLNHIKGAAARKIAGRLLVNEISRKLQSGWNPFDPTQPRTGFFSLEQALDQYGRIKTKQTRHSSPYTYSSMSSVCKLSQSSATHYWR